MAEVIRHASSNIAETTYYHNPETDPLRGEMPEGTLLVEFNNGRVYRYDDVPRGTYTQFITSGSRGRAFRSLIEPYGGEEV